MSESFHVRLATLADAGAIAWHRARMYQDMGDVPPELFDAFCTKAKTTIQEALGHGDYIGWLASADNDTQKIIGGAGVQLHKALPRPVRSVESTKVGDGRQA